MTMDKQAPASGGFSTNLCAFFILSWLHMLWISRVYFAGAPGDLPDLDFTTLFYGAAWLLYSAIYLLPALALTVLTAKLPHRHARTFASAVAFITSIAMLVLVRADGMIYDLYRFHINDFVLNLVFTPGGIASLGSGTESVVSVALMVCNIVGIQGLFYCFRVPHLPLRRHALRIAGTFLGVFLLQGAIYGASDVGNYGPVLNASRAFPFFQRVRFRKLAGRFGFEHAHRDEFSVTPATSARYPLREVPFAQVKTPPNIIMLVAESLRWDQLDAVTMPNTWAFSRQAQRFERHYSSGNGTREGLFGMFYGLYGSYWESFMAGQHSPLLMQRLQDLGYTFDVRTSATFTYPEFDRTLFADLPANDMHVADGDLPAWQRDSANTDELLGFIERQPADSPFFEFFFFESTHAPYSFPEAAAEFPGYGPEMDYASLSRAGLAASITPIYTRYRNAAHWVDLQLGRIYAQLERQGLLDNTIVIVTGDHGDEFMEKGAWGHNSSFVEEQTHVPFVMALPRAGASILRHPTSHLDVATTLLQMLGAGGDTSAYTLGRPLLDASPQRHLVISDWHSIGIVTPELKYRIPYLHLGGMDYWAPTDATDVPLSEEQARSLIDRNRNLILETMANCTKFSSG
jgi:membrane-anchored protein YejM (alkaline phosphatase superfamily)